ncbi:flagellar hook-basal body complex protein FliE [Helicovermis profundi]|uniref:Flagellar hook-basal body complex protein FliE n=1 Tax=Helicovermis profundi TaxID=3065157 RepID=A0AAU9E7J1_9FIRM|nr:flagellar hook-basal body complex protein FliE [Clostridia bacterium S502]
MSLINGLDNANINNISKVNANLSPKNTTNVTTNNFSNYLLNALDKVNESEIDSNKMDQLLAVGDVENLHEVMIASQKAEVTLDFAVEVRNKIMDAYKEIMRIQF